VPRGGPESSVVQFAIAPSARQWHRGRWRRSSGGGTSRGVLLPPRQRCSCLTGFDRLDPESVSIPFLQEREMVIADVQSARRHAAAPGRMGQPANLARAYRGIGLDSRTELAFVLGHRASPSPGQSPIEPCDAPDGATPVLPLGHPEVDGTRVAVRPARYLQPQLWNVNSVYEQLPTWTRQPATLADVAGGMYSV